MAQGMALVGAVGDSEGIKRAVVSDLEFGLAFIEFDLDSAIGYRCHPKNAGARYAEVVGMWKARRAQRIESNHSKGAVVWQAIRSQKHSTEETTVGVESIFLAYAGVQVSTRPGED